MNLTSPGHDKTSETAPVQQREQQSARKRQAGPVPAIQELFHHYQPILGTDGRPVIYESLVRWRSPEGIILPAMQYLQEILQEDEDILAIFTAHTIDTAAAALSANPHINCLSINMSPRQICSHETLAHLASLEQATLRRLMIEVTQDLLPEPEAYNLWLGETAALGVDLILDAVRPADLTERLPRYLPVEGVKLDRSLLPGLTGEQPDHDLVTMISELRKQKLSVTAEGVEHIRQIGQLAALGCNRFQGYGIGMPLPGLQPFSQLAH